MAASAGAGRVPVDRTVTIVNIPYMAEVRVWDIMNGTAESASSLLVRPTIPAAYKWAYIENLPVADALKYLSAFIAIYKVQLRADGSLGEAARHKAAICLAVSRAVAMSFYRIGHTQIMPGELAAPVMEYKPAVEAPPAEGSSAATTTPASIAIKSSVSDADVALYSTDIGLTDADKDAITVLLRCTLGTVPLQGYSLLLTNHHYLSDPATQSRKAFMAVEKQFWREKAIQEWIEAEKVTLQDVLWHKSCHPIQMNYKVAAATSEMIKEQLVIAGAGSAAARLPALETEARAGASYVALFQTVKPMFDMYDGGIDFSLLELALDTVKRFPPQLENTPPLTNRDARIPASVVNRRTAVAWVTDIVRRNAPTAAHCYGFYIAMSERSAMAGGGGGTDTLRSSFALKKLMTTCVATYTAGYEQYADYNAARAKARSKGIFEAPAFRIE